MARLQFDISITHHHILSALYNLYKYAESNQSIEDRLYGLFDTILNLLALTAATTTEKNLACFPQFRLTSLAKISAKLSIAQFMTVIPDFALLLTRNESHACLPLIMEIKRLVSFEQDDTEESNLDWLTEEAYFTARTYLDSHIPQILAQGFCAMNAFPNQPKIHLILSIGIYFSHFVFTRPPGLPDVPEWKKMPNAEKVKYIKEQVRLLLPSDSVKVLVANKCVFELTPNRDLGDELRLSKEFLSALHACMYSITDMDAAVTVNTERYRLFSIPEEEILLDETGAAIVLALPDKPDDLLRDTERALAEFFAAGNNGSAPGNTVDEADDSCWVMSEVEIEYHPPETRSQSQTVTSHRPDYRFSDSLSPVDAPLRIGSERRNSEHSDGDFVLGSDQDESGDSLRPKRGHQAGKSHRASVREGAQAFTAASSSKRPYNAIRRPDTDSPDPSPEAMRYNERAREIAGRMRTKKRVASPTSYTDDADDEYEIEKDNYQGKGKGRQQ